MIISKADNLLFPVVVDLRLSDTKGRALGLRTLKDSAGFAK